MTTYEIDVKELHQKLNDIQNCITNFTRIEIQSNDFYQKMVELNKENPEYYGLVQAMIMLFSKMETSNKQFQENVYDYSVKCLDLKKYALDIISQQEEEIKKLRSSVPKIESKRTEIKSKSVTGGFKTLFLKAFNDNPKEFFKITLLFSTIFLFILMIVLEIFKPKIIDSSINHIDTIIKTAYIKDIKKDGE